MPRFVTEMRKRLTHCRVVLVLSTLLVVLSAPAQAQQENAEFTPEPKSDTETDTGTGTNDTGDTGDTGESDLDVLEERDREASETVDNPNVFVAHKQNYVLPVSYTSALNRAVYDEINPETTDFFGPEEVKFQLSLKVQLNDRDLFLDGDTLQAAFTIEAWWQLYSKDVSSPFRESNYQPEVFYTVPMIWRPYGLRPTAMVGIEHQSNGRAQGLSRSWNRIYAGLILEGDRFYAMVKPWYRIPEKEKPSPTSPEGDDNPDILDFMGHGEVGLGWRGDRYNFLTNIRGNTTTKKGAIAVSISFPLFQRFRGVVQYFNGYGDALVDYDHFQQRLGVGILLSNLF